MTKGCSPEFLSGDTEREQTGLTCKLKTVVRAVHYCYQIQLGMCVCVGEGA